MTGSSSHVDANVLREENRRYFIYTNIAVVLIALIGVEIVLAMLPWADAIKWTGLVLLMVVKFGMLIWWFMHLKWENVLLTVLFVFSLFLALGSVTAVFYIMSTHPVSMADYGEEGTAITAPAVPPDAPVETSAAGAADTEASGEEAASEGEGETVGETAGDDAGDSEGDGSGTDDTGGNGG